MNPEHVGALDAFVRLHTHRLPMPTGEPLAYLIQYAAQIPLNVRLIAFSRDDIVSRFDTDNLSVQWLLKQMHDMDASSANLIGMHFDDGTIIAHTVKRGAIRTSEDSDEDYAKA